VKTVRLVRADSPFALTKALVAKPRSDMEVELTWQAVPGAAYYRVYRGDTAAEIVDRSPTSFHLVAITSEPRHLDRAENHGSGWIANRLQPSTAYFYRVEAVSSGNVRGPYSEAASVTTLATDKAACAPGVVEDLHAILVTPLAPANAINLLWRTNVEPNISAYEIHRSTEASFTPTDKTLLAKVDVQVSKKASDIKFFDHQMYFDKAVDKATTYHYRVRAITSTGKPGPFSADAEATTKADNAVSEGPASKPVKAALGADGTPP
jgi:hypothetical protein